jgi:cobalt/nickel transport system permease protein
LKIPSVAGSSSHPTGVALAAILFGPRVVPALALVVLMLQALLLAHGGISTLGANLFSLGVCGPLAAWTVYRVSIRFGARSGWACGIAAFASSLAVYSVTSLQLAIAYPDPASGVAGSAAKFAAVFAWTQIPVAVTEGFLTSAAFTLMNRVTHLAPSEVPMESNQ